MAGRPVKRQRLTYPLTLRESGGIRRTYRSAAELNAVEQGKAVEKANTLPFEVFEIYYCPYLAYFVRDLKHMVGDKFATLEIGDAKRVGEKTLKECFRLIEATSAEDYRNSEMRWSASRKKKEMVLLDLKYFIIAVLKGNDDIEVGGFISYMITYEDGHEVVYVYEIHLAPEYQRKGIGRKLMGYVEQIGINVGVKKMMLTVFRSNQGAISMYEALGYGVDKYSPQPKILRNGTLKENSYVILSKSLEGVERADF